MHPACPWSEGTHTCACHTHTDAPLHSLRYTHTNGNGGAHATLTQTQRDIQFVCVYKHTRITLHLYSTVWGALSPPLWLAQQPRAVC